MFYLAAAVADFFLPWSEMVRSLLGIQHLPVPPLLLEGMQVSAGQGGIPASVATGHAAGEGSRAQRKGDIHDEGDVIIGDEGSPY